MAGKLYKYDVKGTPFFYLPGEGERPKSIMAGGTAKLDTSGGKRRFILVQNTKLIEEMHERAEGAPKPGAKVSPKPGVKPALAPIKASVTDFIKAIVNKMDTQKEEGKEVS